jgi:quinol monooxygenase YgiN
MYLTLIEATTTPATRRAFLEREGRFQDLVAKQSGLRAVITVRSLGNPGTFARGTLWESAETAGAFAGGAEAEAWFTANPLGTLGTLTRPVEAYDLALEVGDPATAIAPGMHMVLVEWALDMKPGYAQAFEQSRKELFDLRKQHNPGFVRSSLYRYMGDASRYLAVNTTVDRAASLASEDSAPIRAFLAAHPGSAYSTAPRRGTAYEVVTVKRHA